MENVIEKVPVQETLDLEAVCREYGTGLLRMATLYLRDAYLAEDAVQETLIKLYRSRDRFDPGLSEKAWIMRILINTCKDMLRTPWMRRVEAAETVDDLPDHRAGPEAAADRAVVEQIQALSPKYRDVILLFYYQDLSTREIAEVLEISEGAVRVRLNRGRTMLKSKLKDWWEE